MDTTKSTSGLSVIIGVLGPRKRTTDFVGFCSKLGSLWRRTWGGGSSPMFFVHPLSALWQNLQIFDTFSTKTVEIRPQNAHSHASVAIFFSFTRTNGEFFVIYPPPPDKWIIFFKYLNFHNQATFHDHVFVPAVAGSWFILCLMRINQQQQRP